LLSDAAPWLKDALALIPELDEPFEPSADSVLKGWESNQESAFRDLDGRGQREQETEESEAATVHVFTGCVTPWLFPKVSRAVDTLLRAAGHRVVYPEEQTCCGALHLHEGDEESARWLARRNILAFETDPQAPILVEAAGCGAVLKSYGDLLKDIPLYRDRALEFSQRVKDLSEWLAEKDLPKRSPVGVKVALQDPCHLYHVQRVRSAPRRLLEDVAGVEIVDVEERDICCGSAGISNLLEPENGQALGMEKARVLARANPDLIVTSNPGCLLQLQKHVKPHGIPVRHLAQVLEAYWPRKRGEEAPHPTPESR
jgi:glycolate oxidase iron-sulfur subunit